MGLNRARRTLAGYLTEPVVHLLVKTSVTPNALSVFGLMLALAAAALIAFGQTPAAGIVMLVAGYFDIIDGAVARKKSMTTRFGGVLDSTLDRVSESAVLLGILMLFVLGGEQPMFFLIGREWAVFLVGLALLAFPVVSHIRAKAEALGIACTEGVFTRTERVVLLALGLLINQIVIFLTIITLFTLITAGQRLYIVWRGTKG